MTRYTVTWTKEADDELAEIWVSRSDRQQVADAARIIDAELSADPESKGEEKRDRIWILRVPPLHAYYEVSADDRVVSVFGVRQDAS